GRRGGVGVERLALLPEGAQAQVADRGLKSFGDGLEAAGQLIVVAGPADVIEHRQQLGEHARQGELAYRGAITVDSLAIVGVFSLDPLQVGGPLGQLYRKVAGLAAAVS